MLTKDGQVVVVDFGLALAEGASRLTRSGTAVGTAYYMAPEIARGQQADRRSDIYSLAAVLYEMLTGSPPFQGDRLAAVIYAAVHEPVVPPSAKRPAIPAELDRIVLKALSKKPDDRYGTMEGVRDDLEALEAGHDRRIGRTANDTAPGRRSPTGPRPDISWFALARAGVARWSSLSSWSSWCRGRRTCGGV
jgi:serine/threonine-protein kinase